MWVCGVWVCSVWVCGVWVCGCVVCGMGRGKSREDRHVVGSTEEPFPTQINRKAAIFCTL